MRMRVPLAPALALALVLTGCTVGPDFHRLDIAAPSAFGAEPTDVASRTYAGEADVRWWERFGDAELSSLVERLGRQSLELQQAAERIQQARAERRVTASQGLPRIEAQGSYVRQRESTNGMAALTEPAPDAPNPFNLFRTVLSASWELDLFGRVRRATEAAGAEADAAVEARRGLALSAASDLVQSYCQLRLAQAQEALVRRNLALAEQRRALVRNRFANGIATTLEVAQADAQALGIAQDLPSLRAQQASLVNAIGLLLAEPPRTLTAELTRPAAQPLVPPAVPIGLPADLARRRPDVREAEARLHAATAQTGVAIASFYPDINLTGSFGFESLHLGSLFDRASTDYRAGPMIDLPIFQGGRLTGTLRVRQSQQREAALAFRQTVLGAWHDVDNALTGYAEAQHRRADAVATSQANARALAAADQRYREGVSTFLDVITEQQAVLRSDEALAQAQAQIELRLVDLYKALGGGWQAIAG